MKFKIIKETNKIDQKKLIQIVEIIKSQNNESIISSLEPIDLEKYLKKLLISKNNYLFLAYAKKKIIGYIIYTKPKTNYLTNKCKLYFLFCLLKKFKIISILNLIFKITDLDKIFFSKQANEIYTNSINLSYLGIIEKFQSKGIGKKLIYETIKFFNIKKIITVETYNKRAQKFYKKKCNFKKLGIKIQLFKKVEVFFLKTNKL